MECVHLTFRDPQIRSEENPAMTNGSRAWREHREAPGRAAQHIPERGWRAGSLPVQMGRPMGRPTTPRKRQACGACHSVITHKLFKLDASVSAGHLLKRAHGAHPTTHLCQGRGKRSEGGRIHRNPQQDCAPGNGVMNLDDDRDTPLRTAADSYVVPSEREWVGVCT